MNASRKRAQIVRSGRIPRCLRCIRQGQIESRIRRLELDLRFQHADYALRISLFSKSLADSQQSVRSHSRPRKHRLLAQRCQIVVLPLALQYSGQLLERPGIDGALL